MEVLLYTFIKGLGSSPHIFGRLETFGANYLILINQILKDHFAIFKIRQNAYFFFS